MKTENKNTLMFTLFMTFAKIGVFTFGGGYAMIALIEAECVDKKKWITHDEMMNVTVIAESTPGPIALNCATYVGYKQARFLGALFATLGMLFPSFIIIYLISMVFDTFLSLSVIANAFKGIKVAVGLLILNAAINMLQKMSKKIAPRILMLLSCLVMLGINIFSLHLSSIYIMLTAGVISLSIFFIHTKGKDTLEVKK